MAVNHLYQPWRAILYMINQCLTGKTSGHDRPRYPILQMLWGIITKTNVDYAELMYEEFLQAIQTFLTDKANLGSPTKKAEEDLRLGNLKFVPKGKRDEVFGKPIPNELITNNIRNAPYYNAYLEMVAKHDQKVAAQKEGKKKSASTKQSKPKPAIEKSSKLAPAQKPKVTKEKSSKASTAKPPKPKPTKEKTTKASTTGKVEGKGKAIVTKEQAAQYLLALHKPKRRSTTDQFILQRRILATKEASTRPSTQPHDDTPTNIIHDSPSPVDVETKVESNKTNSGGDTEILQIGDELGEDMTKQVNLEERTTELDQDQARSDPGESLES
ncbi:hypothetical protein Tco_1218948 [Tanacetum coccineum]